MTHAQRLSSNTTKLVDVKVLIDMRTRCSLYEFEDVLGINLDVSQLRAQQAAASLAVLIREWYQREIEQGKDSRILQTSGAVALDYNQHLFIST